MRKKIILAPDSFKGTIRSPQVCAILQEAFQAELPEVELISIPMADGGEGTVEAVLAATAAEERRVSVRDPLGRAVTARFAFFPETGQAVLEMAEASGLERLREDERNPLLASTDGTGELLEAARRAGARELIIGIGGSATVDGGSGLARALGVRLLDAEGRELSPGGGSLHRLAALDFAALSPAWQDIRVRVACDVTNPLLGERGAARVFGPQKGATPAMVEQLERGLARWGELLRRHRLVDDVSQPGDGAAGGLGFGLRALLSARMQSGARLLAEITGLPRHLRGASLLITGEGRTDAQTGFGKLPAVLAELARAEGVPAILLSGSIEGPQEELRRHFTALYSTLSQLEELPQALARARESLYNRARALAATLRIGQTLSGG